MSSYGYDSRDAAIRHRTLRERMFGRSARTGMGTALLGLPVIALVIFGVIFGVGFLFFASYTNSQTRVCTVDEKDRTLAAKAGSDMRIYTEECGVLHVKDMHFAGEWNSADTYNAIEVGKTYEFTTTGYRVGFLSMFPVIREFSEVTDSTEGVSEAPTQDSTLTTTAQVAALPLGAVVRSGDITFERVEEGFQVVSTGQVKSMEYVASLAPLTVVYLP